MSRADDLAAKAARLRSRQSSAGPVGTVAAAAGEPVEDATQHPTGAGYCQNSDQTITAWESPAEFVSSVPVPAGGVLAAGAPSVVDPQLAHPAVIEAGAGMASLAQARVAHRPAPARAVRVRPVRLTVDVSPADHNALARWCLDAAGELGVPRVHGQELVRALLRRALTDRSLRDAVLDDVAAIRSTQ